MPEVHNNPRMFQQTEWEMPDVLPGDVVYILRNAQDPKPQPAIVNKVNPRRVMVNGFVEGVPQTQVYGHLSGIRHRDDPDLGRGLDEGLTCWVESPQMLRLRKVEAELAAIKHQLDLDDEVRDEEAA